MEKITAKYFSEREFQRLTPPCSLQDMDQTTMDMADAAREKCGFPFVITSAYRSSEWDKARKRSGNGAHTKGKALDFKCPKDDSVKRFNMVVALLDAGFKRIGIGENYIHADNDDTKAQNVIWTYY